MTLREKINRIIESDTELDRGLLIVSLLDNEGLSLDGNGWLDDDPACSEELYSDEVLTELQWILPSRKLSTSCV